MRPQQSRALQYPSVLFIFYIFSLTQDQVQVAGYTQDWISVHL